MRIFITGGTGYIGGALCRRVAAEGHDIRALVRPTSDRQELDDLEIECFEGDITDRDSMRGGMDGADWVIHAAAELDFGTSLESMESANLKRRLLNIEQFREFNEKALGFRSWTAFLNSIDEVQVDRKQDLGIEVSLRG